MIAVSNDIVIAPEEKKMAVKTDNPDLCLKLSALPEVKAHKVNNDMLWLMPWNEEACRFLLNCGMRSAVRAAPLLFNTNVLVEGKYKPMQHQLNTAAFITLHKRCYVLSDPRTGKTGSVILALDYLQRNHMTTGAFLIVTTVTTMESVWSRSLTASIPSARVVVAHGKKRVEALQEPADFYLTNYDSIRVSHAAFVDAISSGRIGGIVVDEATHVGNSTSARHKSIADLCKRVDYCIGITGSPAENVEHVFGMAKTINPDMLPCRTKTGWSGLVTYQYGPEPYMRRPNANAPAVIFKTLQPAIRYNKKDIIDLPPVVVEDRECRLSTEQETMLNQFRRDAIALAKSGETITAVNGGALYNKIMQVSIGFCIGNTGKVEKLDAKGRHQTIIEAVGETQRKVVVFGSYKAGISILRDELEKAGYSVGVIDGSVTGRDRAKILDAFANSVNPHVLVCHPTTTAYGVELAAADTMIFDGPPPLGGFIYAQALERLSSSKQTANKISIIRVYGSAEEKKYFKTLDNGKEMSNFVSVLFEDYKKGGKNG